MSLLSLVLMALATWRLMTLLVYEDGPWHLLTRFRGAFGVLHDDDGPMGWPTSMPGSLFRCTSCMGLWIAPLIVALWWVFPVVVWALALSGAANLLESRQPTTDE